MGVNYLQELRDAENLLDIGEKTASEGKTAPQEEKTASPSTEKCNELAEGLLKAAAEMRGDTPKGGSPADSEAGSSIAEATGISEEELKRRLLERLRKKRQAEGKEEVVEEGGEKMEEGKEAAASTSHYKTLPSNTPPYPKEVGKLMAAAPPIELSESDLKKGLMAFAQKRKQESGGKK